MADLVLDFDACKSIVKAGNSGQYILKPVVSVHQRLVAAIQGFVSTALVQSNTTVSAQQNGATVRSTAPDSTGRFVLYPVPVGVYDLVIMAPGRVVAVACDRRAAPSIRRAQVGYRPALCARVMAGARRSSRAARPGRPGWGPWTRHLPARRTIACR